VHRREEMMNRNIIKYICFRFFLTIALCCGSIYTIVGFMWLDLPYITDKFGDFIRWYGFICFWISGGAAILLFDRKGLAEKKSRP
jgi:hypothetical protein